MPNPFSGIITSEMKTLHQNMIDALLYDDALTVTCRLIFEGSLYNTNSPTTIVDPIGNKPAGSMPFGQPSFALPDSGVTPNEETTTVNMMVIWDSKSWIKSSFADALVHSPEVFIQTLSMISGVVLLKQADRMVVDTDIEAKVRHTFVRYGEPEPCGLGASTHVATMWKKIGG